MYKRSLIKLFFKGYPGMLPGTLAEELIIHGDRPSSRLKHGLYRVLHPNTLKTPFPTGGAVLWNAIGRTNRAILERTDLKSFLKNVVKCNTFKEFNLMC